MAQVNEQWLWLSQGWGPSRLSVIRLGQRAYSMQWTFSPEKAANTYQRCLTDPQRIRNLLQEALERIDFDVVEQEAKKATPWIGQQQVYSTAYKVMLIVFYIVNWDTECRFMGRSVRQRFEKPSTSLQKAEQE